MSFSLLAPLALGLSVLVALPVAAHMARQVTRERQEFGAVLLLQRVVERLRRRRRVQDPLLLLLRVLAVLLVAMALAGAVLYVPGDAPEHGGSGRVVLVIDRSLSMSQQDGGSSLLSQARARASRTLRELPDGTLVAAVAFDETTERLVPSLTAERGSLLDRIEALRATHGRTDLRGALLEARRLLGGEPGEVLVYTDEAGSRAVAEATGELQRLLDAGATVVPVPVHPATPRNVTVTSAAYGEGIEGGQVTLRVANYGSEPLEVPCEVLLPDGARVPIFADLPPEGEVEERVTIPSEALGGVGEVRCDDPVLPLDNARYFHLPRIGASRVLVVDGDPGDTPVLSEVYFLERALAPWGGLRTGLTPDVVPPTGLDRLDSDEHRVVFVANIADPRPYGPALVEFVRRGGGLVISAGDNVTAERYNDAFREVLPAPIRRARSVASRQEGGLPLVPPDPSHRLFESFARAGRAGFSRVHLHRVLTLEPYQDTDEVTTLLELEGGIPALVSRRVGLGTVVLWTGTVDLSWGDLPLQATFMPLVQSLVEWLGGESGLSAARFDGVVGERISLVLPDLALEPQILGPDGPPVTSRIEGSRLLFRPTVPGAYQVRAEREVPLAWVAVNVDPEESDVRPGPPLAAVEQDLAPELFLRELPLGGWLWWAALVVLVLQALLSVGRTQRTEAP